MCAQAAHPPACEEARRRGCESLLDADSPRSACLRPARPAGGPWGARPCPAPSGMLGERGAPLSLGFVPLRRRGAGVGSQTREDRTHSGRQHAGVRPKPTWLCGQCHPSRCANKMNEKARGKAPPAPRGTAPRGKALPLAVSEALWAVSADSLPFAQEGARLRAEGTGTRGRPPRFPCHPSCARSTFSFGKRGVRGGGCWGDNKVRNPVLGARPSGRPAARPTFR